MSKIFYSLLFLIPFTSFSQGYFQQEVNYKIDVTLNDRDNTISAYEEFEYINNSSTALDRIYVHLWPNAYKNTETALAYQLYDMNDMSLQHADEDEKGWIDSLNFQVNGEDVKWEYDPVHIDICVIHLNSVLKPGDRMTVTTPFKVKIPSGSISRLGHVGESYQITQWYPKPAVFDKNGWHAMPYLTQGEFYSEYGSFDVSITLPKNYVVGATGDLQTESEIEFLNQKNAETVDKYKNDGFRQNKKMGGGNSTFPDSEEEFKTIRYTQKNVHDFAWFADKRFEVLKGEVELPHSKRVVTTWCMFVPHHADLWENSLEYIHDGTYYYSLWNGDYPYNNVTAVDGTISAGGGMEYPNVTVIGNAGSEAELEIVIVHEVGHNWFYGQLGSNERDHAWMDEGMNTLNEIRYIETKYPKNERLSDMMMGMAERIHLEHLSHHDMNDLSYSMVAGFGVDQPIELSSADYSPVNYGAIVYSKTGLVFTYLKDYLGEETFDKGMQLYYSTWEFKHPQPEDLRKAMEEASGKDLGWFFDGIITTTSQIDYKIKKVKKDDTGTTVFIKNIGQVDCPTKVDGLSLGKVRETQWIEPGQKKAELHFEGNTFDQFIIDSDKRMPEINRNNNYWKQKGFHRVEKLKMEFLAGDDQPEQWNCWYLPVIGGNAYDKFMLGFMFHNITIPKHKFQYTFAPMFSFGRKNLAGFMDLNYSIVPKNNFRMVTFGLTGKTFGNGIGVPPDSVSSPRGVYFVGQPYIDFEIGKPRAKKYYKQNLRIQGAYVYEDGELFYDNTTIGAFARYRFDYNKRRHSFTGQARIDYLNIEQGIGLTVLNSDLINSQAELKYKFKYWDRKGKHVEVRAFIGQNLVYNGTQSGRYGFALGGQSGTQDAMYEYYMMGRNEGTGLWSAQRLDNHGGFKTVSDLTSTKMLFSTNMVFEIPYVPLVVFADYGMYDVAGTMESAYDVGAGLRLGDLFAIYVPLYESDNLANSFAPGTKFHQKIRFSLNLNGFNPTKLVQTFL